MSINALIAQGGRPIGEDLPQIANMLAQRDQQNLQNNRLAVQDQYAAEQHAQQTDQYNQAKTDRDALQANGESARLLQIKDPNQFVSTLQQMPHVVDALHKAGVDLNDLNAVRQHVQGVYQATAAHLGQAPPKPMEVSAGASLVQPGQNPGDPYTPVYTAPKPENLQRTPEGYTFDASTGVTRDSSGRVMSTADVQNADVTKSVRVAAGTEAARNKAKLAAFPSGSVDAMVESWAQTGQVPQAARGVAIAPAFWAGVSARAAAGGNTIAAQEAQTRVRASIGPALTQTTKQIAANKGFVDTLHANIQDADGLVQQLGGSNSPILNRAYNQWKKGVTGDPETAPIIAKLDFWNNAIQGEAAKIASGGVGSVSSSSDAQISKQVANLNTAQSYKVWRGVVDSMSKEGGNRMGALQGTVEQLQAISSAGTSGGPGPSFSQPPPAARPSAAPLKNAKGWTLHSDKNGNKAYVSPDGKQFEPAS